MTLTEFINGYDREGVVVLLEGKREVLEVDRPRLVEIGRTLTTNTRHMRFRSGNAGGSDELFAEGVASVDASRMQVILPYKGHRNRQNKGYESIALEEIDLAREPEIVYLSKKNAKTSKLIDPYVSGVVNRLTTKAAYILRDTVKVLGTGSIPPAAFGIFYDDLSDPMKGGTGHTMKVCMEKDVPLIDQRTWFSWLGVDVG
jgi:hypothetical protein